MGEPIYDQSAVIPWRRGDDGIEVLLVTSWGRRRWVIPKGLIEPDMTPAESAENEAWEEAGVRGEVDDTLLGTYEYEKWSGRCHVQVFAMRVTEELDDWEEADARDREWMPPDEAADRVREAELKRILRNLNGML